MLISTHIIAYRFSNTIYTTRINNLLNNSTKVLYVFFIINIIKQRLYLPSIWNNVKLDLAFDNIF